MPVVTANHALVAAAGALALTLYDRGVFKNLWGALQGANVPLNLGSSGGATILPPGAPPVLPPTPGAGIDWTGAEAAVVAQGPPDGTGDWLNWCLNFVNRVYSRVGLSRAALGAPDAATACSELSLQPGIAPKGGIVCFKPTATDPQGHIGISNGSNLYTSVGVAHGGISVLDYISNPNYSGWSA